MNSAGLLLLALLIVLGNGLRSVVTSTVSISQGSFASFLSISVEATTMLIEQLMGAVLLSLLLAPWLMQRFRTDPLAVAMTLLSIAAAGGLAVLFFLAPPVDIRVAAVAVLFPLLGFGLATLAPISQRWIDRAEGERHRKLMLGAWSVAMPCAFLITPQLVRVVAPRYGLDVFFLGFAGILLSFLFAMGLLRMRDAPRTGAAAPPMQGGMLFAALMALFSFQLVTFLISVEGLRSALVMPAAGLMVVCLGWLIRVWRRARAQAGNASSTGGGRQMAGLFLMLFLLNMATTGFYDNAFMVRHLCSNTLIADRATISALAQVAATLLTAAALRWGVSQSLLILLGVGLSLAGLASYMAYPGLLVPGYGIETENLLFIASRSVTGAGVGMALTAAIFAVDRLAGTDTRAPLFLAFVVILGTEVGLEAMEVLGQAVMLARDTTSPPYLMFFLLQAMLALLSLSGLFLRDRRASGQPQPA
ncbi:hypothetical protein SAMN05421538_11035 [Paracoccus isoporae]|uniref:Major Facilitator Superfamily protein n=1 Tax=Paracoccus isoporae TaxID=591205 RepID=A0A1G7F8F7_9RHOB|nr:hypothetical protein [Paracoccus isoporae]SDE71805.1 hypothetical protein SAMN05421538_11035 [Paracoccus isoporae]